MTDVLVTEKDVVVEVKQPTVPDAAQPPKIGLVEINQMVARGSIWSTGHGAPTLTGGQAGDMYLDVDTGDIYRWDGVAWVFEGTFAPATLTPAEILAALLTVDGAGSNLDADKLDGQHGAYYAKQSDMDTQTARNDTQDAEITQNSNDILGNTNAIDQLDLLKAPKASPVFTGDPKAPTPAPGDNDTSIATTAFVTAAIAALDALKANINSPTFTGDPKAPTPTAGDNDTSIATTAFVATAIVAGTTPAGLLAKLLTVDGAGSALDADLLDGQHGAYYLDLTNATNFLPAARFNDTSHGARGGGTLHALATSSTPGFMQDAPADSFVYGRKNNAWATVIGGATTDDSPPPGPLQDGQLWWKSNTGVMYIWYDDGNSQQWVQVAASPQAVDQLYQRKAARSQNRVVNPTAQLSQENGTTAVTTSQAYPADQWQFFLSGIVGQAQKVTPPTPSPDGATSAIALSATTAKASLAAGDYLSVVLPIEGQDISDFLWGTAAAKQVVLRFNAYCAAAGTFPFSVRNTGGARSFVGSFTVPAAGWQTVSVPIPGDVAGTWATGSALGLMLCVVFAAGTTSVGVAGWQSGNFTSMAGMTNGAATANQPLYITDVGLYADPDLTGVAPKWQPPDLDLEIVKCQRYWEYIDGEGFGFSGNATSGSGYSALAQYRVQKRANPTLSGTNASAIGFPTTVGTTAGDVNGMRENRVANATGAAGFRSSWQANARM